MPNKTVKTVKRRMAVPPNKTSARALAERKQKTHQHVPWKSIPLEALNPLLQRQFIVGQEIMLARVLLKKGSIVPRHSHHNEQLTYILEGALKFWIGGKIIVFSGDTNGEGKELIALLRNADLFIAHNAIPESSTSTGLRTRSYAARILCITTSRISSD